jgi:hypothetical protein
MKTSFLILAVFFPLSVFSQLPEKSSQLVKKLNDWELERQVELQKEIAEKRAAVVSALQAQMIEVTKTGDLNGAMAIKAEIERLAPTPQSKEPRGNATKMDSRMSKSKFSQELTQSKWQYVNAKGIKNPNWIIEFTDSGSAKFWYGTHDYEVIEPLKIRVSARNDVPETIYTFSPDLETFSSDSGSRGERKVESKE